MQPKNLCNVCGNEMHFREYPESGGRGIWECFHCDDDVVDLSNTCPNCGGEMDNDGYCEYCDMTRQAHEALYPED